MWGTQGSRRRVKKQIFRVPERLTRALHVAAFPPLRKPTGRPGLRMALVEAECGRAESEVRRVPAWKLFLVLPRMLLFCPDTKEERFLLFAQGEWLKLLV